MTDYIIEIGELVWKWFPHLEWDDIMEIVTSDNKISKRAKHIIDLKRTVAEAIDYLSKEAI